MEPEIPKVLQSSIDPAKISLSVKGILVLLLPVIMLVTPVDSETLNPIVSVIGDVVFYGASFLGSALALYGLVRKALVVFGLIKPK